MISNKDLDALEDIIYCINLIYKYSEELSKEDFYNSQEKQDLLVHRLEILGEASKRLSKDITDVFTDIPWKQIKGMRDVLVHQYDDIMLEIVWETVQNRIPEIEHNIRESKNIIEKILLIEKELKKLIDRRKGIFILKDENDYCILLSKILREYDIKYKLINSIERINFNKSQSEIILFHFGAIDDSYSLKDNINVINLKE